MSRALGEYLHEPEASILGLQPQRLLDRLLGPSPLLVVEERAAPTISAIFNGSPVMRLRPVGVVVVFCPSSVVGAICPPVIP
jgi:hypothetical protein